MLVCRCGENDQSAGLRGRFGGFFAGPAAALVYTPLKDDEFVGLICNNCCNSCRVNCNSFWSGDRKEDTLFGRGAQCAELLVHAIDCSSVKSQMAGGDHIQLTSHCQ